LIRDNQEELGLDPLIFDLVYEGFWDLYTFKPKIELSPKKLLQWIAKINLLVTSKPEGYDVGGEEEGVEEEVDEDGNPVPKANARKVERDFVAEPIDPTDPITAVVRVRIPKIMPEPEVDEEGQPVPVDYNEEELDEVPYEDKVG
jgi:hypothetical protein